jgi:hypothetical protein
MFGAGKMREAKSKLSGLGSEELYTVWGENLNGSIPLSEYPRPQLMRRDWLCLNGPWQYAVCPEGEKPDVYLGEIIVPFTPETLLSGVRRRIRPGEKLWYKRSFSVPGLFKGQAAFALRSRRPMV